MGYACPVCETPQQDARHLANHLAFTAMVHGDEHEAWLDDHVPDWAEMGEADLGPEVAEHAPETDYDQVFEDTAHAHGHDHAHDHQHGDPDAGVGGVDPASAAAAGQGSLDEETRKILAEARELTAEMLDDDSEDGESGESAETDGTDTEE
ncbi:MAG: DUF5810 domain-containing protein [Halobellus sp.]